MTDNHYENSKLAAVYDLDSGWSADRDFYLALAGSPDDPNEASEAYRTGAHSPRVQPGDHPSRVLQILDVGCGTGLICNAYAARNHDVVGVDPSASMLDVARKKPNGDKVEWIQAYAQTFKLNKSFDLIIMTGHAFQVLHTDDDLSATLQNMRNHLKQDGVIVFESRNPAIDWTNNWNYDVTIALPDGGTVEESRRIISFEDRKMTFELRYQFEDESLTSESVLRFWTLPEIQSHLSAAGLSAAKIVGDWDGKEFDEKHSEEMIFYVCKQNGK